MTCIIGLLDDGKVYMGADSLGATGWDCYTLKQKKIFKKGRYLVGVTGRLRTLSILSAAPSPPEPNNGSKVTYRFMVREFIPWLKKEMSEAGFAKRKDEVDEMTDSWLIVGTDESLFMVAADYALIQTDKSYLAGGCGEGYALGSLFSSTGEPKDRIKSALKAAEEFSAGVRGPFHILEV